MSLGLTGVVAQELANRPYDRALGEATRLVANQIGFEPGPAAADAAPRVRLRSPGVVELLGSDDEDSVYFQVLGLDGTLAQGDRDLPVPEADKVGAAVAVFRDDTMRDEPVRVAALWVALPGDAQGRAALVQVAETLGKRSRLSTEIIKGVILPQFVFLPLAVLLVWLALARGIRPLSVLQERIRARPADDLSPIDERAAPEELMPLVASINGLLERLDQSMVAQKHFIADAAHQLKTPLAGLRMQAEIAAREIDAGQRDPRTLKASLEQIALSSQRAAHAVNQLLAMARAEDRAQALRREKVDLASLTQEVVRELVPKALERRIDLGYEGAQPGETSPLVAQPVLLGELVRNLLDNALQYTPAGGSATARVLPDPFGQAVVLQVEDSGPGVPQAERELIFQPFYRALGTGVDGTGLGLAIVQEIAQQHGAQVTVDDAHPRPLPPGARAGALFTVRFPVEAAGRGPGTGPTLRTG
jgi:two-component system sensor histidine kinase TctE